MHKLKTLIRNVRKGYRADSALFDWDAEVSPRNLRKQWEPDATKMNRAHLVSVHPNRGCPTAVMFVKGDNYFK